jgi:hypothetical protein
MSFPIFNLPETQSLAGSSRTCLTAFSGERRREGTRTSGLYECAFYFAACPLIRHGKSVFGIDLVRQSDELVWRARRDSSFASDYTC